MRLSVKLSWILAALLVVSSVIIVVGMPRLFSRIAERQMRKEAQTFGLFLLRNLEDIAVNRNLDYSTQETLMEGLIYREFEKAIAISGETGSFVVDEILLLTSDFRVEVGYPKEETGRDYSDHPDIAATFRDKRFVIVLERHPVPGSTELDIDILSYLTLNDEPRVLEVKLNFQRTIDLLSAQYRRFNLISVGTGFLIILGLTVFLLVFIRRTAVEPVLRMADALDRVGRGDLDVRLSHPSDDEFGLMSGRFNEMVTGLKERLQLSRYVSQSTRDAVRTAVSSGQEFHTPRRKRMTVFFSDIRGFTAYSEKRDPEHIVAILNRILTLQTGLVARHGGYIDKFVGDETMAIFPDVSSALLCALDIQAGMLRAGEDFEDLRLGIGVYEGLAVEGDIGSETMKDFTVIGDTVNTAARLQSVAAGGEIVLPASLAERPEIAARFETALKGVVKLKGKEAEMRLYRVTGRRSAT